MAEARRGLKGWLTRPAATQQWERVAVWVALGLCMGFKLAIPSHLLALLHLVIPW